LPHLCIQKFSPVKKCFIFDSPTHWKKLAQLETLYDDELDPEFVQQVSEFCSYIFSHSKTKTLPGDIKVNGPREFLLRIFFQLSVKKERNRNLLVIAVLMNA
jgi:hypothetical protein